jgi:hypothetical protein
MAEDYKGMLSFGSMTLAVGGLALFGLLAWGWMSGQSLPLWPALLVAAVNVVGALKLVQETKAKRAAMAAAAAEAAPKKRRPK